MIPLLPGPTFDDAQHRIAPHIVIDAPADCELMQREIFGPILPLISYDSIDEVMARINAGPRPLALYPFSNDQALLDRLIEQVMSGGVSVNDALMHVGQDDLPLAESVNPEWGTTMESKDSIPSPSCAQCSISRAGPPPNS